MIALIIVSILLTLIVFCAWFFNWFEDEPELRYLVIILGSFFMILCAIPVTLALIGSSPIYGNGVKEGYLVKVEESGMVWKTNEIYLQMGTGDNTGVNATQALSVPNQQLLTKLRENMGKHVRVHYNQWLCMPIRLGNTNYEVVDVEIIK